MVERYGTMCHSGPSIHLLTNPYCPYQLMGSNTIQDKQLKQLYKPIGGECCILQSGMAVHTCCYMSSPAVIYILSLD